MELGKSFRKPGALVTQLSEPPILSLSLRAASQRTFACPPVSLPQRSLLPSFDCPQVGTLCRLVRLDHRSCVYNIMF